jgi:two-component system nitrogen regulation response regulator GlnG
MTKVEAPISAAMSTAPRTLRSPNLRTAGELAVDEIARSFAACGGDLDAMAAELQVSRRALGRRVKELGLAR